MARNSCWNLNNHLLPTWVRCLSGQFAQLFNRSPEVMLEEWNDSDLANSFGGMRKFLFLLFLPLVSFLFLIPLSPPLPPPNLLFKLRASSLPAKMEGFANQIFLAPACPPTMVASASRGMYLIAQTLNAKMGGSASQEQTFRILPPATAMEQDTKEFNARRRL